MPAIFTADLQRANAPWDLRTMLPIAVPCGAPDATVFLPLAPPHGLPACLLARLIPPFLC